MRRKLVILLAAVCAVSVIGGCGKDKKGSEDSKTAKEMEYDASDYVKLGDYKGLKVSLESDYEVTEEAVKSNVESMLAIYPAYEDSDKTTVENGDFVNIDYEGLRDGEAFDGGSAKGTVLEIGSNSFIEGFEEGLIGAKVGDKVELNLTFPEDYQNAEMAGVDVVFNVTVNKIVTKKDMTYDNMTDQYVTDNFAASGYKTVEELKNGIKDQLTQQMAISKENDTQNAILKKLKEECPIESLPEGVLDQRVKEYKDKMEKVVKESYQMDMEEYFKSMNITEKDFNTQVTDYMQENLEMELILGAIAEKEKIEVDEKGYKEYLQNVITNGGYKNEEELMKEYGESYVKSVYCNNKAMELVREKAEVTYGKAAVEE